MKPDKGKRKEKASQPVKKAESSKGGSILLSLLFNLIGGAASILFIYFLFYPWTTGMDANERQQVAATVKPNIEGYFWLYNLMLLGNLETIKTYPDATIAQRYEMKSGEIGLANRIKQQTPDSAIILIPPRKILVQSKLTSFQELPWLTYFLYPRKIVYEDDKDSSKLPNQANYIMELNGWGFDKLNYRVDKPEGFMVLPLKKRIE